MTPTTTFDPAPAILSPAEIYDSRFVPALFSHWAPLICDRARLSAGQRVLDIGCGTGALTTEVARRIGPAGHVVGIDPNPEMLAVARRKPAAVDWRSGAAEALPFEAASFDVVLSQFAMMFFSEPVTALREMRRVLTPTGRIVVAVCDAVERSPGYSALARLLESLFGRRIADAFRAPFVLGDPRRLRSLCAEAGLTDAQISSCDRDVRFASVDALVAAERDCVWTLGGLLDERQFDRLRDAAVPVFAPFVEADGQVRFVMPALLIEARAG